MALRFFSVNNSSNGGDNLWQIAGGTAPNDIELNTGNGADGIDASLPSNDLYRLLLTDKIGAEVAAGFANVGGADYDTVHAIVKNAGDEDIIQASITSNTDDEGASSETAIDGQTRNYTDRTGNNRLEIVESPFVSDLNIEDSNTGDATNITITDNSYDITVANNTTDIGTHFSIDKDNFGAFRANAGGFAGASFVNNQNGFGVWYYDPATNNVQYDLAVTGNAMRVVTPGTNNRVFALINTGAIQTNQTAASGVARAKVAEMPIYDSATGTLVGYIPITL